MPVTEHVPKPLVPVLNIPLFLWAAARLYNAGVRDIAANVHHLPAAFHQAVDLANEYGPHTRLVEEAHPTGPLGGLLSCRLALPAAKDYLVISGDALQDIDVHAFLDAHRQSGADLTIAVSCVPNGQRYGVVRLDERGFVISMREKPLDARPTEQVSCGIYAISARRLFSLPAPKSRSLDFVDLISTMLDEGDAVFSFTLNGWRDIGTVNDLLDANLGYLQSAYLPLVASCLCAGPTAEVWLQGTVPPSTFETRGRVLVDETAIIGTAVALHDVVVGAHAIIGKGATIVRSVILPGAAVEAGARLIDRVVS